MVVPEAAAPPISPRLAHFATDQHKDWAKPSQAGYSPPQHPQPSRPGHAGQIPGPAFEHLARQPGKGRRLDLLGRQSVLIRGADAQPGQAGLQAFKQMRVESAAAADNQLAALFSIAYYARHTSAGSEFR